MKTLAACLIPGILGALFAAALFAPTTPTWFQPGPNMVVVETNGVKRITPNTASIATRIADVANADHWCKDFSGTTAYLCSPGNAASWPGYNPGNWVLLVPSATSVGSASLNIHANGLANIKRADGTTDPGNLLVAGRIYLLVYDGVVWRMSQGDSGTTVVALDTCTGSGPGWDCRGLYRIKTASLTLIGTPADNIPPGLVWTPAN